MITVIETEWGGGGGMIGMERRKARERERCRRKIKQDGCNTYHSQPLLSDSKRNLQVITAKTLWLFYTSWSDVQGVLELWLFTMDLSSTRCVALKVNLVFSYEYSVLSCLKIKKYTTHSLTKFGVRTLSHSVFYTFLSRLCMLIKLYHFWISMCVSSHGPSIRGIKKDSACTRICYHFCTLISRSSGKVFRCFWCSKTRIFWPTNEKSNCNLWSKLIAC